MGLTGYQEIVSLRQTNLAQIESMLDQCGLPFSDCREQLRNFVGVLEGGRLLAIGATQLLGPVALLRSIVVLPEFRGQGLAQAITAYLLEDLKSRMTDEVYLLTETAESYFSKLGFQTVSRDSLPEAIKATSQFTFLCPDTATVMRLRL